MKLNNKGITLVEIIISIALISIVLLFLFSLLVTVNDMNNESEVNTTYLITKSLILKNIEDEKYIDQLKIYYDYLKNIFKKEIKVYLFSIIDKKLKEITISN